MSETRKIAAILVADVVGYSRLPGRTRSGPLARLRALRSDLIDPAIAAHHGRIVKRTGDGSAHRVSQRGRRGALRDRSAERHGRAQRRRAARAPHRVSRRHSSGRRRRGERRRSDGRRRQHRRAAGGHRRAGRDLPLGGRLSSGARAGSISPSRDLGPTQLKNIAEPIRVYSLRRRRARPGEARAGPRVSKNPPRRASRSSSCRSPISAATRSRSISSTASRRA